MKSFYSCIFFLLCFNIKSQTLTQSFNEMAAGLLLREDQQFHWVNRNYKTFDDFLGALSSRKRKTLRRERRDAQQGLDIIRVTGADITEAHWDAFFEFYEDTGSPGAVAIDPRLQQSLGVRTAEVRKGTLAPRIEVVIMPSTEAPTDGG